MDVASIPVDHALYANASPLPRHTMDEDHPRHLHIVIVGPCAAGKTTLVRGLWARGFRGARIVAQEHSGVSDLWKMRGQPDVLIYLDAHIGTIAARQHRADWTLEYLGEQHRRLQSAGAACHLYLPTDDLTIEGVLKRVIEFLNAQGMHETPSIQLHAGE